MLYDKIYKILIRGSCLAAAYLRYIEYYSYVYIYIVNLLVWIINTPYLVFRLLIKICFFSVECVCAFDVG